MATTWLVRKTGVDANGGTSQTVRSTGTDGATNVGNNTLTSASAAWSAADIGHGVNIASNWRLVTAVASGTSLTYSGSPIATATGRTWTVGGSFLTIGKTINSGSPVAAGDSIYVGAGIYRELATVAVTGSAGNVISWIADCDGVQTGDPGEVQWTAHTTNDKTGPGGVLVNLGNGHSYLTFVGFLMIGGSGQVVNCSTTAGQGASNVTLRNCALIGTANAQTVVLQGLADVAAGFLLDQCIIFGFGSGQDTLLIQQNTSTIADYDGGSIIRNCVLYSVDRGAQIDAGQAGAGAFLGGGLTVSNCTFVGGDAVVKVAKFSALYPLVAINNHVVLANTWSSAAAANLGSIVEDSNRAGGGGRVNTTAGPLSVLGQTYAPQWEIGQAVATARSIRDYFQPMAGSPLLGFGNVSVAVGIPATAADDSTVGTISWGTPNNAKYPNDANVATAALTAGTTSHYLKVTNFGFAIPVGATITQIRVEIVMNKNAGTGALAGTGNSCKLTKDGTTFIGTDKGTSLPVPTTTNTIYSVGTANDLWGSTWVPADLNSANFGVGISFKETGGSNAVTPQIDYVRVIVNYTPTSLPTAQTQDLTGGPRPAGGSATNAVGAFERGNTAVRETSTTHTGANALKLAGPGYQDKQLDVDAVSTVVSVYLRYDSSYGGSTLPTLSVLNGTECGVANASSSQVGAASTWEKVSLTLVPTAVGRVTLRVTNLSTAAAGNVYADTWGVA